MARTINDGWALMRELSERHRSAVERKEARIAMLKAMIQEWEECAEPDAEHIRGLKARLRSEETQLKVMKP